MVYVKRNLIFDAVHLSQFCEDLNGELEAIVLHTFSLIVVTMYRRLGRFFHILEHGLLYLVFFDLSLAISTDRKFHLFSYSNEPREFLNSLRCFNLFNCACEPTRANASLVTVFANCSNVTRVSSNQIADYKHIQFCFQIAGEII